MHKTVEERTMIYISGYRWNTEQESCLADTENFLSVNCCGHEKYITKSTRTLRENGRPDYQLLYVAKGSGIFHEDGQMTAVPQGNIVIFHPGETQQYAYQYQDKPEIYWIHFTGRNAGELLEKAGLSGQRVYFIGFQDKCIECFEKIIFELQLKPPLYEQLSAAVFMELLAYMGRKRLEADNAGTQTRDANIQKVLESLHTQSGLQWNITDLAKQCNLSPNRFMHKFKAQVGMPAMEYLAKIRIEKAKGLLLNSALSIKEISNIVGYENPLYFSRLFSKQEGVSPKAFRRSHG